MSGHPYTEEQLVEQPAMFDCFAPLGWALAAPREYPPEVVREATLWVDPTGLFGRETTGEAVLVSRERPALERRIPVLPPEAITTIAPGVLLDGLMDGCCNTLISSKILFD